MRDNWKLWLTGAIVLVVLGFVIQRFRTSFGDQPPAWVHFQEVSSPKMPAELADQIAMFHAELENESKTTGLSIKSMQLIEIEADGKEIRTWQLETLSNPGPGSLPNLSIDRTLQEGRVCGYYSLDGSPLNFLLRHHPSKPKSEFAAVKFDKPVAPGVTVTIISIEHQPSTLRTNAAGEFSYQFPRLRNADKNIQAVGVILPSRYTIVRYGPTSGAFTSTKGAPIVAWINTRVEAVSLPPSVTFKPL